MDFIEEENIIICVKQKKNIPVLLKVAVERNNKNVLNHKELLARSIIESQEPNQQNPVQHISA